LWTLYNSGAETALAIAIATGLTRGTFTLYQGK
jgi:hypothetical protein